jgi:hypothetical protein
MHPPGYAASSATKALSPFRFDVKRCFVIEMSSLKQD